MHFYTHFKDVEILVHIALKNKCIENYSQVLQSASWKFTFGEAATLKNDILRNILSITVFFVIFSKHLLHELAFFLHSKYCFGKFLLQFE